MSVYLVKKPIVNTIQASIQLNGSKSISNRVLIIDALSNNQIRIDNLSNADDTIFLQQILQSKEAVLDAGAGGTTFRFLTAFLATQEGRECVLTGSERMQQRPIKILVEALRKLGADITYENQEGFPPLRIKGKQLKGGKIALPADTSSQFITALLLIAPTLEDGLELELVGTIVSVPYIKMTLKMMEYFGVETSFNGNRIVVKNGSYQPKSFFVEGDWSAASYFYSIAALAESAHIELIGLTNQQIQGDAVIADISTHFGVQTIYKENKIELIKTSPINLSSFSFDFLECPDLAQTVVAFCAALGVELQCSGLQTLRIKETDRIAALDMELQKLGIASFKEMDSNTWKIILKEQAPINTSSVVISTYEDHRMAMSFAPLSMKLNTIMIEEPNVVTKSYPMFWDDLRKIGFEITTVL
ncbi:MAG TPA: 3-phosphoshikimate 1-carboxyvinyltransferase [Chitinophagales bacterium]|jgi:3-phosphoshikimate 1-carboxyvinyltransferase|nr:3-phosphoshikimate 1-carboxyvinyltransferase [Chitinophagales bacterium]MBP6153412.1 3-phosphoshikimate 1-carboxyvinyltransferase [Chitinophagales bacterium]HQV79139.1 3-phosphoshikimate 1-carboxyvinyltransferase [Chitinophagales bacterium]HQW79905.1 3-phosphoshikimate 1-carboxyvinyltransferase [Chitinophagales bacterium]HRB19371.1 3-phosphoshikimate 1-carboxyvinyltransferase [Chitinophagales bacterium]